MGVGVRTSVEYIHAFLADECVPCGGRASPCGGRASPCGDRASPCGDRASPLWRQGFTPVGRGFTLWDGASS